MDKEYALVNSCDIWWGRNVVGLKTNDRVELEGENGAKGVVNYNPVLTTKEKGEAVIEQINSLYEDYKRKANQAHEDYKNLVNELIKNL